MPPDKGKEFDRRIGSWSSVELIDAASYLLKCLKDRGQYAAFMEGTIGSLRVSNLELADAFCKIRRAGDLVATTNYDMLIEQATGSAYAAYDRPGEILEIIKESTENKVLHLHGVYDKANAVDNIIADAAQYRDIIENTGAQFIQNLLSTHTLVIVGCGGTVTDPNLSGFLKFVSEELKLHVPYFYLMKEGDAAPELPKNASLVYYGQDYSDLPSFMLELSSYRRRSRFEASGLVQFDPYLDQRRLSSAFGRMHFANRFSSFVGRDAELASLNKFLGDGDATAPQILWWGVLGEGGIGKSRLVLEWLRTLPTHWHGFFARKDEALFKSFVPFTDTVIVFDYILGEAARCAQAIQAVFAQFAASPYRLRLLLVERRQNIDAQDWLAEMTAAFDPGSRLQFEGARYLNGAVSPDEAQLLPIGPLELRDEERYIREYLEAYIPVFLEKSAADQYLWEMDTVVRRIWESYTELIEPMFRRPLYLSIFIEVWINKAGAVEFHGAKQLLRVYFEKEITRWETLFGGDETLLTNYLRLLAVACAIESFNITDVLGENYLRDECTEITKFLDAKRKKVGLQSIFGDLFIEETELEEYDPQKEDLLVSKILQNPKLSSEERFAYATPYLKLDADPEEVYLNMLQQAGALTGDDADRLQNLKEKRLEKVAVLPDHAWIITPLFPDIIKEYIVLYVVKEGELTSFTRLARSNSILGLQRFLTRAVEDWPEGEYFHRMLVIPPEEVLNYFEFYLSLMKSARLVADFRPVEDLMLQAKATPPFAEYEMELWRRMAIVLTERGDWGRLLSSGKRFFTYVKENYDHRKILAAVADVMQAYAVGLYNAAEMDKLDDFLSCCDKIADIYRDDPKVTLCCCENRGKLLHLRRYLDKTRGIEHDWAVIARYLKRFPKDRKICLSGMEAADEYITFHRLNNKADLTWTDQITALLERIYRDQHIEEVAELLSLSTANQYRLNDGRLFTKIKKYLNDFPDCQRVRSAYAAVCAQEYGKGFDRTEDVPQDILVRLKRWSRQYPDEIEFQEAYFCMLLTRLEHHQLHNRREEEQRVFQEMEAVAKRANYDAYHETNQMAEMIAFLKCMHGY